MDILTTSHSYNSVTANSSYQSLSPSKSTVTPKTRNNQEVIFRESSSSSSSSSASPTSPTAEGDHPHSNSPPKESNNILTSSSGSNSDNSSTDEGIDNSDEALLDEDDDEDDRTLVSEHSHHEHHNNHHYQHHHTQGRNSRSRNVSGDSRSSRNTLISNNSNSNPPEGAEEQVERFLNGNAHKNLVDLEVEAANLRKEISELEDFNPNKSKLTLTETNLDTDDDDEELLEFQAIEREIKAAELRKVLATIERRIEQCKVEIKTEEKETLALHKRHNKAQNHNILRAFQFATDSMTDSMIEAAVGGTEDVKDEEEVEEVDNEKSPNKPRAPLAVADDEFDCNSSVDSQITSAFSGPSQQTLQKLPQPSKAPFATSQIKLHLSADSEEEEEDDEVKVPKNSIVKELQTTSPPVPPRRASLQASEASGSTIAGPEAILFNCSDFYRQSLHEDALHESIEASLQEVNGLSTADEETFLIFTPEKPPQVPSPPKTSEITTKSSAIIRRESQYENETQHECGVTHRRGYERIQATNRKLAQSGPEEKSHSLDDLLSSSTKQKKDEEDEESFAYRRRSAKFPTEAEVAGNSLNSTTTSTSSVTFRPKVNSESLNAVSGVKGHHHNLEQSTSSLNSANHLRPLTLYLPSPDSELNLITHLHALGHDLTSNSVTHSLLLTPFTCSGYLYKQCAGSTSKWRKRYFHFNRVRKVFVYFTDRTAFEKQRHPKRGVFFDEVQDVYVDHTRMKSKSKLFGSGSRNSTSPSHSGSPAKLASAKLHELQQAHSSSNRCVFVVATTTANRKFILSTFSPELMRIWMDVIFTGANAYLQDYESYDA